MELIHAMVESYQGISVFAGVGERSREGHEMLLDMTQSGVLARTALVYGQMNEPPGARWRAPMTALTIAEYFRDERHRNVLLLMDNVFRFVQAGSEVSGLLGRAPSRVGYQPTLADEVAALHERIASVGDASVTAIEAVYVPADDFTDPAVTTIAAHVDSMVVLSRAMSAEGMYPAVDPIASSSILLDPLVVGEEHVAVATETRRAIEHYRELQDVIALLGMEELGAEDRRIVERARRLQRFLTQPFAVTEAFTGVGRPLGQGRRHGRRLQGDSRRPMRRLARELALYGRVTGGGAREGRRGARRRAKACGGARMSGGLHLTIATPASLLVDAGDVGSLRAEDMSGVVRRSARPRRSPDGAASIRRALDEARRGPALLRDQRRRPDGFRGGPRLNRLPSRDSWRRPRGARGRGRGPAFGRTRRGPAGQGRADAAPRARASPAHALPPSRRERGAARSTATRPSRARPSHDRARRKA